MKSLLSQIAGAVLGLWIASSFVPGMDLKLYPDSSFFGIRITEYWQILLLLGIILGLLNFFIKPVINVIALPLRIITLGLASFAVNMAMIWSLDIMFNELYVALWLPLLYTSLIVWFFNIVISKLLVKIED